MCEWSSKNWGYCNHLSSMKIFMLCDVIFLVRPQGKLLGVKKYVYIVFHVMCYCIPWTPTQPTTNICWTLWTWDNMVVKNLVHNLQYNIFIQQAWVLLDSVPLVRSPWQREREPLETRVSHSATDCEMNRATKEDEWHIALLPEIRRAARIQYFDQAMKYIMFPARNDWQVIPLKEIKIVTKFSQLLISSSTLK